MHQDTTGLYSRHPLLLLATHAVHTTWHEVTEKLIHYLSS